MDNEPEARARDWIAMTNSIPKNAKCNNCTIKLDHRLPAGALVPSAAGTISAGDAFSRIFAPY